MVHVGAAKVDRWPHPAPASDEPAEPHTLSSNRTGPMVGVLAQSDVTLSCGRCGRVEPAP